MSRPVPTCVLDWCPPPTFTFVPVPLITGQAYYTKTVCFLGVVDWDYTLSGHKDVMLPLNTISETYSEFWFLWLQKQTRCWGPEVVRVPHHQRTNVGKAKLHRRGANNKMRKMRRNNTGNAVPLEGIPGSIQTTASHDSPHSQTTGGPLWTGR